MSNEINDSSSEQQRPTRLQVALTLAESPTHQNFTRKLRFTHDNGDRLDVPLALRNQTGLTWSFDSAAAYLSSDDGVRDAAGTALHRLGRLVDLGNRSYWDRMSLVNTGGNTELEIARVWIALSYGGISYELPRWIQAKTLTIVNSAINRTLATGHSEISLSWAAMRTRLSQSQVHRSFPRHLRLCAADLGKSGSDEHDRFGDNSKYGGRLDLLCSEFASWYYASSGIRIGGRSLRHIVGTQQMHDIFREAGQLYYYDWGRRRVRKVGGSGEEYVPRPGDYLERRRRDPDEAQHSMMILRWLPGNPSASHEEEREVRAWVFNGPWPVCIRQVRIHEDEVERDKEYFIGRV